MDGAQDMGGLEVYGPVRIEPGEPVFHAEWERRAFAITLAMARPGNWNIDMSRSAREDRSPAEYLGMTYYEIWLDALERLMFARDLLSRDEVEFGRVLTEAKPAPMLRADEVAAMLRRGAPSVRVPTTPARFAPGDRVRMKTVAPATHTRLPRYVRGRTGSIDLVHGAHVFPDSNANGTGEDPQWLYTVTFDGRELWGAEGDLTVHTSVDAWDSYLEPA